MRTILSGLFAAAALFSGAVRAAEPATAAQEHAALYQREVRAALSKRGWSITRDEAGKLSAERRKKAPDGTNEFLIGERVDPRVHLDIAFRADGKEHTVAAARASLCYYNAFTPNNVGQTIYPPFALRDPKLTQEYRDILAEVDARLGTGHRAHAAAEAGGKVAMK